MLVASTIYVYKNASSTSEIVKQHRSIYTYWLVVEPPLWKIWKSVGMMKFPIYGKIIQVFQTTNQLIIHIWRVECSWINKITSISQWNPHLGLKVPYVLAVKSSQIPTGWHFTHMRGYIFNFYYIILYYIIYIYIYMVREYMHIRWWESSWFYILFYVYSIWVNDDDLTATSLG